MPFPDLDPTMPSLLASVAERFGPRTLLVTGSDRSSYEDVEARRRAVAAGLISHGIGKGSHVGILMPNSSDWVVAFYAITRIGAIAVPVNTFVPPASWPGS